MILTIEAAQIKEHPDYFISRDGKVFSYKKNFLNQLKPRTLRHGYLYVSLSNQSGKFINKTIHRLLAQAFIPNPDQKDFVNHKDGNKKNNALSNLEWCTAQENINHSKNALGNFIGEKNGCAKLTKEQIIEMRKSGFGPVQIGRMYGISFQHASKILRRQRWAHI